MAVLPFDWGALTKILLRPTMSSLKVRPSIVRPQNVKDKINGIIHPFIFSKNIIFNKIKHFCVHLE